MEERRLAHTGDHLQTLQSRPLQSDVCNMGSPGLIQLAKLDPDDMEIQECRGV